MRRRSAIVMAIFAGLAFAASAFAADITKGWYIAGSRPADYNFGIEHVDGSAGKRSAFIKAKPEASSGGFGTVMQTIKADNYIGQRVRLSGRLKSENAPDLQLWMRIDGDKNAMLEFYNMGDRPVVGTTDWKRYDIVLDVPSGSTTINYGFFLSGGKGAGWADAFTLERVGKDVPVSGPHVALPSAPVNMNFEE